jgi:hypothetical protein
MSFAHAGQFRNIQDISDTVQDFARLTWVSCACDAGRKSYRAKREEIG